MYVCMCDSEVNFGYYASRAFHLSFRNKVSLSWQSPSCLGSLASKPQGSAFVYLPGSRITSTGTTTAIYLCMF